MTHEAKALTAQHYFTPAEIMAHLDGVEYIIMATPSPGHFKKSPIHFTIFLNTIDALPDEVKMPILEKFMAQYGITHQEELMSQIMPVGFAQTNEDTPMPLLLINPQDQKTIPHRVMHVMDFLGDSDQFETVSKHALTGWTYAYDSDD